MSTFVVDVRPIEKIEEHPNADKLELGKVQDLDYQFVIQKGQYKEDDLVVFFPVDSLIPQNIINLFELKFLSGKDKNRVKTVCLRGKHSQGLVLPFSDFINNGLLDRSDMDSIDVKDKLGVTKYEPPEIFTSSGNLVRLPDGLSTYDIEGYERYPNVVSYLMDIPCQITEKLEGTNFSVTVDSDGNVFVNSRNYSIVEIDNHVNSYWETARKQKIIEIAKHLLNDFQCNQLTIYGEMIGPSIQKNIYKLSQLEVRVFDIKIGNKFMDANYISGAINLARDIYQSDLQLVPELGRNIKLKDWLNGRTIAEASDGKSILNTEINREGIVIKPMTEMYLSSEIGRVILKKRSPLYLSASDF